MYRYYYTLRPPAPMCQPKGFNRFFAYDDYTFIESIGRKAWGWVEYDHELTSGQYLMYDLVPDNQHLPVD